MMPDGPAVTVIAPMRIAAAGSRRRAIARSTEHQVSTTPVAPRLRCPRLAVSWRGYRLGGRCAHAVAIPSCRGVRAGTVNNIGQMTYILAMADTLTRDHEGPVLIVGGYGTVGSALTELAAPHWPLLLTGRNPEKGAALADKHGATVRRWDLTDPAPFRAAVRAVIGTVNDPIDRVLTAAVGGGVPYVDITRWTSRMTRAVAAAAVMRPRAPVLFSSAWMGGITSVVAAALISERGGGATSVDIAVRWDMNDMAGIDSVDFMDRLGYDYEVRRGGLPVTVAPLTDPRIVNIAGSRTKVVRIDTPEQLTLPITLDVGTVSTRIGFSSGAATTALLAAKKVGLFRWGKGDRWTSVRRSLLYSPGEGGNAEIRVDVDGEGGRTSATVVDPRGQAHLTALGGFLGLRRVLDPTGSEPGVTYPELHPDPASILRSLPEHGVEVLRE
ncbi:saccharopine dehydrogenase [Rhodococcus aetherivorans]